MFPVFHHVDCPLWQSTVIPGHATLQSKVKYFLLNAQILLQLKASYRVFLFPCATRKVNIPVQNLVFFHIVFF